MTTKTPAFFFCIGAAKSGTTLLARVLDQHPDIACIWESYAFHPRSKASLFNPASASWRKHGFNKADVQRWAAIWRTEPRAFIRRILRKLTGRTFLATSCFRQTMPEALGDFARRCGASVVGDKWPQYIYYLGEILSVFPKAKLIYNVRDPRGVWNSGQRFQDRMQGDHFMSRMLEADSRVDTYLRRTDSLTIRYEDLLLRPKKTSRELYTFLECDFSTEYLSYNPADDPYPQRWTWIPEATNPIDRRHADKWRRQLSARTIAKVTDRASWFIEKYGYER
jgi:hypothetical protein